MRADERGQVTAFVAGMVRALLVLAGLVIDGGYALAARRRAIDEANGAARAGAQALAVSDYRSVGTYRLDPAAATAAANAYLSATGHAGSVRVAVDRVEVTVTLSQPMALLRIVGLDHLDITGWGQARSVRGIRSAAR